MAGAFADPAVGDDLIALPQSCLLGVELLEFGCGLEGAVFVGCLAPGHRLRAGDMAAAQRTLFRVGGHVGAFAGVFFRAAHIDERQFAEAVADLGQEGADDRIVAFDDRVFGGCGLRLLGGHLAAFGLPFRATAVHEADVFVTEEGEDPQCVGGPPVGLVAVDDDGVFTGDALGGHKCGEALAVDVVTGHGVVEFSVPIDLDRSGNVPGFVEQHVFVAFDDDESGIACMLSHPIGADQSGSVRVFGELLCGICRDRSAHAFLLRV